MLEPSSLGLGWSAAIFALLVVAACGNRASGVAGSGSSSGTSSGVGAGASTGASGTVSGSGTASGSSGMSGSSGATMPTPTTFVNYELTGTWPALIARTAAGPIKQQPGALTYKMVQVHDQFLAESCAIADYNHDGIPDLSSGRRWYEGPDFTVAHIYRNGHEAQPRSGHSLDALFDGVSDDWADYPFDMDGDGWPDIINIAGARPASVVGAGLTAQQYGTGYWYKNPGNPANATDSYWAANQLTPPTRPGFPYDMMAQRGLADVDGDGKPEILGAASSQGVSAKGYYQGDWGNPTAPWTFHAVTRTYVVPFTGAGPLNGIGMADINGDGRPDLLERSGAWLQPLPNPAATPPAESCTGYDCTPWPWIPQTFSGGEGPQPDLYDTGHDGGSHMFATDVDGDGDLDIISADSAFGWGLSWYEQTMPVTSCIGYPSSVVAGFPDASVKQCFIKHQIIATESAADLALYHVGFSELAAVQVVDMDGDGLPDIVTGKMFLAHAYDEGDPDNQGTPVLYVFKLVRDANPPQSGKAHFEPHLVNAAVNGAEAGALPSWTGGSGIGRQIAIGQINPQTDGIMDICIASKLGLYVYFGQ